MLVDLPREMLKAKTIQYENPIIIPDPMLSATPPLRSDLSENDIPSTANIRFTKVKAILPCMSARYLAASNPSACSLRM